jgi:hypothetical protein
MSTDTTTPAPGGGPTPTTETPAATAAGRPGRAWRIAAAPAAGLMLAVVAVLAVMLAGQSGQIGALRTQVAGATTAAANAQHRADQASTPAQAAGKTQAAADNANLGVCVSYGNGLGQQTVVTSPIKSPGGAVSCYSGTFTPVSPQAQTPPAG